MDKLTVDNDIFFHHAIELLKEGKNVTIPVRGYSMMPFIRNMRDSVILEGVEAGSPDITQRITVKTGDIVLFRYKNRFLLHRIIMIRNGLAEIQGDGVVEAREYCRTDEIYGRVTAILRNGTRKVNPYSSLSIFKLALWNMFSPVRRYILAVMRRLPYFRDSGRH